MSGKKLVCRIVYADPVSHDLKGIVGIVFREQIFSQLNHFIQIENMAIHKDDIEKIVIYKKEREIVFSKQNMETNSLLKIEG